MAFASLVAQAADPLLGLMTDFRRDPRASKLDLGVGVYRDADGCTPVMTCVKRAEAMMLETQHTKAYLGPEGDPVFVDALLDLIGAPVATGGTVAGVQTPGGTGALRLGAELLAAAGVRRIWVAEPSWPNHIPILAKGGMVPVMFDPFAPCGTRIDPDGMFEALRDAMPGDAVLLHGCCHNPTGIDPDAVGWAAIAQGLAERGLMPFVDLAYHGLGDSLDRDLVCLRALRARCPSILIAYSCDKNFGLYRERTGALLAEGVADTQNAVMSTMLSLARANWSMPPDHGAAIVRTILQDADLSMLWRAELAAMQSRLTTLRAGAAELGRIGKVDLSRLRGGKGLFAKLPISPADVAWLRDYHAIYMPTSGRINIAGLSPSGTARLGDALQALDEDRN